LAKADKLRVRGGASEGGANSTLLQSLILSLSKDESRPGVAAGPQN